MRSVALTITIALAGCTTPEHNIDSERDIGPLPMGLYVANLRTEGENFLPFMLHLNREGDELRAFISNGEERIEIPQATLESDEITLAMPHFASTIRARWHRDAAELRGTWTKRRGQGENASVRFAAKPSAGATARFASASETDARFEGRWKVLFEGDDDPAIARFEMKDGEMRGTFLTTTGDYRYLAGGTNGDELRLSCFDGAHAFLFHAKLEEEDRLTGHFWYGNWGGVSWTATRDASYQLADAFAETRWVDGFELKDLNFPDLEGRMRNLASSEFAGKARILQIFGSWCPNCHDASRLLKELHEKYAAQGLAIVALAFELSGDVALDREQIRRYRAHHQTPYPILLAGVADKPTATKQLRALNYVKSYPTTIFLDANGKVEKIHSGFAGPATGTDHEKLKKSFEEIVIRLLEKAG